MRMPRSTQEFGFLRANLYAIILFVTTVAFIAMTLCAHAVPDLIHPMDAEAIFRYLDKEEVRKGLADLDRQIAIAQQQDALDAWWEAKCRESDSCNSNHSGGCSSDRSE